MERRQEALAALALVLLTAAGCTPSDPNPTGSAGELGAGRFNYECVATGDAVCNVSTAVDANDTALVLGISREVPLVVAVDGRFDLFFDADGRGALVEPARRSVVSGQGGFVIGEPGVHAFLARTNDDGIADFIHVEARRVSALELWAEGRIPNQLSLAVGERLTVAVLPRDAQDTPLAGGGSYDWSTSTLGQIDLEPVGGNVTSGLRDDEVELVGLVEGTVTLTVARGDVSTEIAVEVTPAAAEVAP